MSENSTLYNIIVNGSMDDLKKTLPTLKINTKDEDGMSLLAWAAIDGSNKKVAFLLENGANPNIKCNEGMTPLMYAASHNHPDIIRTLLKAGANPEIGDKSGWTAETWADIYWNEKAKFVLREHRKTVAYQKPFRIPKQNENNHSR